MQKKESLCLHWKSRSSFHMPFDPKWGTLFFRFLLGGESYARPIDFTPLISKERESPFLVGPPLLGSNGAENAGPLIPRQFLSLLEEKWKFGVLELRSITQRVSTSRFQRPRIRIWDNHAKAHSYTHYGKRGLDGLGLYQGQKMHEKGKLARRRCQDQNTAEKQ